MKTELILFSHEQSEVSIPSWLAILFFLTCVFSTRTSSLSMWLSWVMISKGKENETWSYAHCPLWPLALGSSFLSTVSPSHTHVLLVKAWRNYLRIKESHAFATGQIIYIFFFLAMQILQRLSRLLLYLALDFSCIDNEIPKILFRHRFKLGNAGFSWLALMCGPPYLLFLI